MLLDEALSLLLKAIDLVLSSPFDTQFLELRVGLAVGHSEPFTPVLIHFFTIHFLIHSVVLSVCCVRCCSRHPRMAFIEQL